MCGGRRRWWFWLWQGMRLLEAKREMLDMAEVLQQADEVGIV